MPQAFAIQLPVTFSGSGLPVISTAPSVIFGSSLMGWLSAGAGVSQSGGSVSSIVGQNAISPITLSQAVSGSRPSFVSSAQNSQPGIQSSTNQLLSGAPGPLNFEYTQPFSLSIAFKFNSLNAGQAFRILFASLDSSLRGWLFSTAPGSKISVSLRGASSGVLQATGSTTLINGTAYVAHITYDGSGQGTGVNLYLNGVAESKTVNSNTLGTNSILGSSPQAYLMGNAAGNSSTDTFLEAFLVNHVYSTPEKAAADTYMNSVYSIF